MKQGFIHVKYNYFLNYKNVNIIVDIESLTLVISVHFRLALDPFTFIFGLDLCLYFLYVLSDPHKLLHYLLLLLRVTHYIVRIVGDARGQIIGLKGI